MNNFTTYTNPVYKITMQFPSDWTVSYNGLGSYTNVAGFYPPLSNVSVHFPAHLILSVLDYAKNITLDNYTHLIDNRANMAGMHLLTKHLTTISGRQAQSEIYEFNVAGSSIVNPIFYTVSGNKVYVLSFFAERAEYFKYLPILERMVTTFVIY